MKSLIIFVGAGASRGISDSKYPMALDFKKRLGDEILNNPIYSLIVDYISRNQPKDQLIYIEHILWELDKTIKSFDSWTSSTFCSELLLHNQISTLSDAELTGQRLHDRFSFVKNKMINLKNAINALVYEYYSQIPTIDELNDSWIPFLQTVSDAQFDAIDIFTTNYDMVIETAFENFDKLKIDSGRKYTGYPSIDLNKWRAEKSSTGLLTKLHGSVDWRRGNGSNTDEPVIRHGMPEFDGNHDTRLILYPGFKGEPSQEPFISFHNYFKNKLNEATDIIFIGFAFRDDYINQLILSNLKTSSRVAVINPSDNLPKFSFLSKATHIKNYFGNSSQQDSAKSSKSTIKMIGEWLRKS